MCQLYFIKSVLLLGTVLSFLISMHAAVEILFDSLPSVERSIIENLNIITPQLQTYLEQSLGVLLLIGNLLSVHYVLLMTVLSKTITCCNVGLNSGGSLILPQYCTRIHNTSGNALGDDAPPRCMQSHMLFKDRKLTVRFY